MTAENVADFEALIDIADPLDLELRPPAGGNKWSADLMEKSASRPSVGVQGRILDAMDDERITRREASALLDRVHARLGGGRPGMSVVDDDGNLTPVSMEAAHGTRP